MRQISSFRVLVTVIAMVALAALPCFAAEVAVLKNGFSIRHERREVVGDITRLYTKADGSSYVDVRTADIEHFEAAPDLPPDPSPASGSRPPAPGSQPSALRTNIARSVAGSASLSPFAATNTRLTPNSSLRFPQPRVDLNEVVNSASDRYRLDPDLVNSVIKAESGFNSRAVSPKGAQGLMQLMPGTASKLGVPNAFDPQANVEGGTRYLRELLERYNFDLVKALAAYNAGPQRVEQYRGVPPYYETRAYVARIVRDFNKKKIAQKKAATAKTSTAKKPATDATAKAKPPTPAAKSHNSQPQEQASAGKLASH
jgi:hypothetical protein